MPSRRAEIFDWSLLALLVLAVYATLGYARTLFDLISAAGMADVLKGGVLALLAAIGVGLLVWMTLIARVRRVGDYAMLAALAAAYALVLLTLSEMPVERVHLIEYGVVGLLAHRALRHRFTGGDRTLLAVLITLNVGLGDELIQGLLPRRFYDTKDIVVNALAGLLGVLAAAILARGRKKESGA